jgi:5-methylcytosine-specific restriction protein B
VYLDREHQIGHSYFTKVQDLQDLKDAFQYEIIPLLQEYFYEDYEMMAEILSNKNKGNNAFIGKKTILGKTVFEIKDIKNVTKADFKNIYNGESDVNETQEVLDETNSDEN